MDRSVSQPTHPNAHGPDSLAVAAWHSAAWLAAANAIGVVLAAMLLLPRMNLLLAAWTYGRWMPVHMNMELYGWCSLPLVAFLFYAYNVDRSAAGRWSRAMLWVWAAALLAGCVSWLNGHTSGKLFLDWSGYVRVLFPVALLALWLLLAYALQQTWRESGLAARVAKCAGLAALLAVPVLIYVAASPALYPPINPDSGGPTGASQLESALVIVVILLLLPYGLTRPNGRHAWVVKTSWIVAAAEALLCLGLGRADASNLRPVQYLSLASLLVWIPLTPLYYAAFAWNANTRMWRIASMLWWAVLVPTGWMLFLPGVLSRAKFTDGLVAHSLLAMAGFVSSLLIFVLVQLLGERGWIFTRVWSFWMWQLSVAAYVVLMFVAGWFEGADPAFNMVPGVARMTIYVGRFVVGAFMFVASVEWLVAASAMQHEAIGAYPAQEAP